MGSWQDLITALGRHAPRRVHAGGFPVRLQLWRDWDSGEQVLDELLCYGVVAGDLRWRCGGAQGRLGRDGLLLLPPGSRIRLWAGEQAPQVWRCRIVLGDMPQPGSPLVCDGAGDALVLLGLLIERAERPGQQDLCRDLLSGLLRCALQDATGDAVLDAGLLARLRAYLLDHRQRFVEPAELAAVAGLSPAWFTRRFKAAVGEAPRTWIVRERLRLAAALLAESAQPIATVASELGYADPRLFIRQFKRYCGCTPGIWRRRNRPG